MNGIFHLKGTVKHYDWGGFFFLPALLKLENPGKKPFAEYWIGTHPLGAAEIELAERDPVALKEKLGDFPYLFKILDVREMLSIQVHPGRESAKKEFARENEEGIPLDAAHRNYKDANHKPELMVALTEFWLLQGFKPTEELIDILINITELNELLPIFSKQGYSGLYKKVMEMPQVEVNRMLQPLIDKILPLYKENKLDKSSEDFWAARAAINFSSGNNIDRGIFSIYFFNLIELKKMEGIFQAAGIPHAYLEGRNIEIMANSDNVLRGGLTNKHIDVNELMKHIKLEAHYPEIITPLVRDGIKTYPSPAEEFSLSAIELSKGSGYVLAPSGVEILLLTEGVATISIDKNQELELGAGHPAAIVIPDSAFTKPPSADIERKSVSISAMDNSIIFTARGKNKG